MVIHLMEKVIEKHAYLSVNVHKCSTVYLIMDLECQIRSLNKISEAAITSTDHFILQSIAKATHRNKYW